jgi:hypothetical protein
LIVPGTESPDALSAGHKAAAGDKTDPRYGGNCDPEEYDQLSRNQVEKCGDHHGGPAGYITSESLGRCDQNNPGINNISDVIQRRDAYLDCAVARDNVARQCFAGGDETHRNEIENTLRAAARCERFMENF